MTILARGEASISLVDNLTAESGAHSQCGCVWKIVYLHYRGNAALHLENSAAIIVARLDNALVE